MKAILISAGVTMMLCSSHVVAQTNKMNAGRPSAVLQSERCNEIWKAAAGEGDKLASAQAAPFIVNFSQVDTNGDGALTLAEFEAACGKGMVKDTGHAAAGSDASTGSSSGAEGSE